MSKNDPERLEAEAREMLEKVLEADLAPTTEEKLEEPEILESSAPEEPEETAEPVVEATAEDTEQRGEVSEAELVAKANLRYKNAQARMTRATQETAELRKSNEDLAHQIAELRSQLVESQRDPAKIKQAREDYPELAGPLLDELDATRAEVINAQRDIESLRQSRVEESERKLQDEHYERISSEHPDVQEIIATSEWDEWLEAQDDQTRGWIAGGSSNDVNTVLSRFKSAHNLDKKTPTPQESALTRAKKVAEPDLPKARKSPDGAGKKVWSVEDIKRMPLDQFEKHQAEILGALDQGELQR